MVFAFLVVALLVQVFSKTIIYAGFIANRDYIAKNLCENRDAPEKNCCGKCQLEKRMAKDDSGKDAQLPFLFKSLKEVKWVNEEIASFCVRPIAADQFLFPSFTGLSCSGFHGEIFHPPCALFA